MKFQMIAWKRVDFRYKMINIKICQNKLEKRETFKLSEKVNPGEMKKRDI